MHSPVRRNTLQHLLLTSLLAVCSVNGQTQQTSKLEDLLQQAGTAQSSDNYSGAAALYARATALSPSTPELWSNRGVMEYLAGHMDASATSLKHALQLNPRLSTPMLFLGKVFLQTGKPALALPYLNRAHTLQPDDPEVVLSLAKANAGLNQSQRAASLYATATRLAPQNPAAWFGLGVTSLSLIAQNGRELAATKSQTVWARALYADELLTQGRPLEAMDNYKLALAAASPSEITSLTHTVDWLLSHPDLFPLSSSSREALQRLSAQLKSEPGPTDLRDCASTSTPLRGAACAFWAGNYESSADQSAKALQQAPQNPEALYWSIKAHERLAVTSLSRFEELSPQSAASYVMVGDLYRHQRLPDAALGEYKKALAIDPHDPPALIGAVSANLSSGKLEEAAAIDQTGLADRPLDPQLNLLMAETLAAGNHFEEAKPYLAKCATGPPELQLRVHYLLGRTDSQEGNTGEAIRQFELALPADEDGSIHYQLSRLYRKTGDTVKAQKTEAEARVLIQKRDSNAAIAIREATSLTP